MIIIHYIINSSFYYNTTAVNPTIDFISQSLHHVHTITKGARYINEKENCCKRGSSVENIYGKLMY